MWVSPSGLITIAGGKLTGYRKMAEDTVNHACRLLGIDRPEPSEDTPLPGGDFVGSVDQLAAGIAQQFSLTEPEARRLVLLYGVEAAEVLKLGQQRLVDGVDIRAGEVKWAMQYEAAHTLEDVLYRRTRAALYLPVQLVDAIQPAADMMAAHLGWSSDERLRQVEAIRSRFAMDSGVLR